MDIETIISDLKRELAELREQSNAVNDMLVPLMPHTRVTLTRCSDGTVAAAVTLTVLGRERFHVAYGKGAIDALANLNAQITE